MERVGEILCPSLHAIPRNSIPLKDEEGIGSKIKIRCGICGNEFTWSEAEQSFYADRKLVEPRRCPDCRTKRKSDKETIARLEARVKELESK